MDDMQMLKRTGSEGLTAHILESGMNGQRGKSRTVAESTALDGGKFFMKLNFFEDVAEHVLLKPDFCSAFGRNENASGVDIFD